MSFTAKIKSVKGSLAGSRYKADPKKGGSLLLCRNLHGETIEERYAEKLAVAKMNHRVAKPFIEAVFSPHKSVSANFTNADWTSYIEEFLSLVGIPETVQLECYMHNNTRTPHIHISAARIDFTGKNVVPDSFIGKKAEKVCDRMAKTRGLATAKEIGIKEKAKIRDALFQSTEIATSWAELKHHMNLRGYHFELSTNKDGVNGARICSLNETYDMSERDSADYVLKEKKGYKLSQVDRSIKIADIARRIAQNEVLNQENNQEIAKSNNINFITR